MHRIALFNRRRATCSPQRRQSTHTRSHTRTYKHTHTHTYKHTHTSTYKHKYAHIHKDIHKMWEKEGLVFSVIYFLCMCVCVCGHLCMNVSIHPSIHPSIHWSMGSASVGAQCLLTSSLGEFLGYWDWLWNPGLSHVLLSIALPFAFHNSVFSIHSSSPVSGFHSSIFHSGGICTPPPTLLLIPDLGLALW